MLLMVRVIVMASALAQISPVSCGAWTTNVYLAERCLKDVIDDLTLLL